MTNSFTGTGDFYIARSQISGGTIDGALDDFRIYDRALSAAEIEKLYLEGSDRGLIAHYKFDDSTDIGKCEIDNATNNLTATTVSIVDGIINDAADFDGSTSYLKTSAIDLATTNVYSISFWVKFDTAPVSYTHLRAHET